MSENEELPPLRMASDEPAEQLAKRLAREQIQRERRREYDLESSLAPFRVGTVPYLNSVPLTRGLEDQVRYATPSKLAEMLKGKELDAALVSITEVLFHDDYDILDGIAIASLGEVKSVFLAHRQPFEEIRLVHCDPASLTSVTLLRVLLAEKGFHPQFTPLTDYEEARKRENVLLIGDPAIEFLRSQPGHCIWDLGGAWYEMTGLPFVYAVWALQKNQENAELRRKLREAADFGRDTLDHIIRTRAQFDLDFRKDYLGWHIHYYLGEDERKGLQRFIELLRKHYHQKIYDPRFVN